MSSVDESAEASKKYEIYWAVRMNLSDGVERGGLTDEERAALAARYGVSEDVLLRWERASQDYCSVMGEEQRTQARLEAVRYVREHGKELYGEEFWEETYKAITRIADALPEQDIIRESRAADNALHIAVGLPPAWDLPPNGEPPNPTDPPPLPPLPPPGIPGDF